MQLLNTADLRKLQDFPLRFQTAKIFGQKLGAEVGLSEFRMTVNVSVGRCNLHVLVSPAFYVSGIDNASDIDFNIKIFPACEI
jgi:hypothetical protein